MLTGVRWKNQSKNKLLDRSVSKPDLLVWPQFRCTCRLTLFWLQRSANKFLFALLDFYRNNSNSWRKNWILNTSNWISYRGFPIYGLPTFADDRCFCLCRLSAKMTKFGRPPTKPLNGRISAMVVTFNKISIQDITNDRLSNDRHFNFGRGCRKLDLPIIRTLNIWNAEHLIKCKCEVTKCNCKMDQFLVPRHLLADAMAVWNPPEKKKRTTRHCMRTDWSLKDKLECYNFYRRHGFAYCQRKYGGHQWRHHVVQNSKSLHRQTVVCLEVWKTSCVVCCFDHQSI